MTLNNSFTESMISSGIGTVSEAVSRDSAARALRCCSAPVRIINISLNCGNKVKEFSEHTIIALFFTGSRSARKRGASSSFLNIVDVFQEVNL